MSNLLPETEKKSILKEYRMRRRVVALYLVIPLVIISMAMLAPAYIYASHSATVARSQVETINADIASSTTENTDTIIKDTNDKLAVLQEDIKAEEDVVSPYKIINIFLSYVTPAINIKNISYSNTGGTAKLSVRGIAATDTALLAFSKALENEPLFDSIDLPVSTFVKSTDIDFSLSIGIKTSKPKKK